MELRTGIFNKDLIDALFLIRSGNHQFAILKTVRNIVKLDRGPFDIDFASFTIDTNGELVIKFNVFFKRRMTTKKLAYLIKYFIQKNLKTAIETGSFNDESVLSKNCNPETILNLKGEKLSASTANDDDYFINRSYNVKIPAQWLWIAYDFLMNHNQKRFVNKYGEKKIKEAIGVSLNPILIEHNNLLRSEILKIKQNYQSKHSEFSREETCGLAMIDNEKLQKEEEIVVNAENEINELVKKFDECAKQGHHNSLKIKIDYVPC